MIEIENTKHVLVCTVTHRETENLLLGLIWDHEVKYNYITHRIVVDSLEQFKSYAATYTTEKLVWE